MMRSDKPTGFQLFAVAVCCAAVMAMLTLALAPTL